MWLVLSALCISVSATFHPPFVTRLNDDGSFVSVESLPRHSFDHLKDLSSLSSATLDVKDFPKDNGGNVTLVFANIEGDISNDLLGVYCPPEPDYSNYLDLLHVQKSCEVTSLPSSSFGTCTFPLFDMRCAYSFLYFRPETPITSLLAASKPQGFQHHVTEVHIALTGKNTEMRVMFASGSSATPVVNYGLVPTSLNSLAKGVSSTYAATDLCNAPGNITSQQHYRDPGFLADVLLTNLEPATTYYYQPRVADYTGEVFSFTTAPRVAEDQGTNFIMYADQGVTGYWQYYYPGAFNTSKYIEQMVGEFPDFILHPGDLAYAEGHGYVWEQWHAMIEPYASRHPYMVGLGNHEYVHTGSGPQDRTPVTPGFDRAGWKPWWGDYTVDHDVGGDSRGECAVPVFSHFHMPGDWQMPSGERIPWYSFDYGNVHAIMMSSEHAWQPGSPQFAFLEADLQAVDRKATPWVIVNSHRPMYTSEENQQDDLVVSIFMRDALEDLFTQHRVNLMLTGHYHAYQRSCAVYRNKCVQDGVSGVTHAVVGTAGAKLDDMLYGPAGWSKFGSDTTNSTFGFAAISTNATHLHFRYLSALTQSALDEFTLQRWDTAVRGQGPPSSEI